MNGYAAISPLRYRRRLLFGLGKLLELSPAQASFAVRGFTATDPARRKVLEQIGETFIAGYNAGLQAETISDLARWVALVPEHLRGFAAEGAAMATAVADALSFATARLPRLISRFGREFVYLVHVGAGWAVARVPWHRRRILAALDPLLMWLAYDGLGFHDCYFNHANVLAGWRRARSGYAKHAYDQGIGRALWFVRGGSSQLAAASIRSLPAERAGDLFSGLGLAMAYAGPTRCDDVGEALTLAKREAPHFGQGVAFACEARARAGHIPVHTRLAAEAIGFEATALAALTRSASEELPATEGSVPRYELWRQRMTEAVARAMGERR
jgi:enediyne biosynthesis protein E3